MDKLTKGEIFILKWQYRLHGDFFTALSTAMCRADDHNRARLAKGFPDEVEAFDKFGNEDGWWQEVQTKAREAGWNY